VDDSFKKLESFFPEGEKSEKPTTP
jgi:hypothetical protein